MSESTRRMGGASGDGDVESNGNGITPKDALRIQKYLVQLVDFLEPKTE